MHYRHYVDVPPRYHRKLLPGGLGSRKRAITAAAFVVVILAWIMQASNPPPLGSSGAVWRNLTSTIRDNTASPDNLRQFASLADGFRAAAREESNIALFCQRTLLPSIAAAELRTSSCKQQRRVAREIHTVSSRVSVFVSKLEKLQSASGRLHHASKQMERRARRAHDSAMWQLSGVGMLTCHGRILAQDEREVWNRVERRHHAVKCVDSTVRETYWRWLLLQRRLSGVAKWSQRRERWLPGEGACPVDDELQSRLREVRDVAIGVVDGWWGTSNS